MRLPGAPADALWGTGIGLVLLAALSTGMLARGSGYSGSPLLTGVMVAILLDAGFLIWVAISVQVRKRREARAGYVTVMNERPDLDQVDPRTGRVIRRGGEPFLTREEHLRRIGLVREALEAQQSDSAGGGLEPPPRGASAG
ncbi:hypothetical protein GCM10023198_19020 [Promicromonospora umidemergens]|uniref:PH (Pleckstrin Homology) domain-containing protein n=1 Tax=Promicromonospora umidemergens TaxID=629679 RepID=A0ABP8X0M3_9MICO